MSHMTLKSKYTILPTLCLAGVAFALFTPQLRLWSGAIGLISTIFLLHQSAHVLQEKKITSTYWSGISIFLLSYIILATSLYFIVGTTPLILFLLGIILWSIAIQRQSNLPQVTSYKLQVTTIDAFALPIFAGQLALFRALFLKSTDMALGSPWLLIGNRFFALYAVVLLLLFFYQLKTKQNILGIMLLCVQGILTFSVAAIIYKLGFGYDPMLHRAAQQVIFNEGVITPITPFYIGQYVSVVGIAHLTHLPLKFIDIALVPLLSGILIPLVGYISLRDGFHLKEHLSRALVLLFPLFPLQYFIVTTPHNLATLFTLVTVLVLPLISKNEYLLLFSLLAFSSVAIHPLSGIFALWLWVGIVIFKLFKSEKRIKLFMFLYVVIGSMLTPLMLITNNVFILGQQLPPVANLINRADVFLSLFERPYYFINRNPDLIIQSIYILQWIVPGILIALALFYGKNFKFQISNFKLLPLLFPVMILINIYFLSTWIVSPELGSFEQIQYAERLRHLLMLFILPLAIAQIGSYARTFESKRFIIPGAAILLSLLLLCSWYLTYPQRNEAVHFPGYNASAADFEAAKIVHESTKSSRYIVLSNILTAGASIEQFGFTHYHETDQGLLFHYPIPSGSPLYDSYIKMLYEGQKREFINEALALTDTDKAYFLVHDYWANANDIIEGAKKTADDWQIINDGQIWLFEYNR